MDLSSRPRPDMGYTKRIFRRICHPRHTVHVTGDITVAIGKINVPSLSHPEGNGNGNGNVPAHSRVIRAQSKTHKALQVIEEKGFKVLYYLHVEIDRANNLGRSDRWDARGLFRTPPLLYLSSPQPLTLSPTLTPRRLNTPPPH